DEPVITRDEAIGVAEEVREEGAERRESGGPTVSPVPGEHRRRHQRPGDERSARLVDLHGNKKGRPSRGPASELELYMASTRRRERRFRRAVLPHDHFHLILELELALLEGDFFELFGFRKVLAGCEAVDPLIQVVMLSGELAELVVALQQLLLHFLEVCWHFPLPGTWLPGLGLP